MRHIISVLLENESGALSRVSGLFSARSYNIESLSVAPSEDESTSRMTIVTSGNDNVIEQIVKQLDKLLDVIEVSEITSKEHVEREIAFVKIKESSIEKSMMDKISKNEFLKIHKTNNNEIIIECVDSPKNINIFLESLENIAEKIVRSGAVGINSN
ncbi:MAG: acetolactate synthase small subunit [Gammaproteobacteria bacterium]|tara:strand:- start:7 stop:477 length:471 start_codon:yes stop_codon:yes gene_type:complete